MTTKLIQKLFNNFLGLGSNMKKNCLLIVLVLHCINGFSQTDKKSLFSVYVKNDCFVSLCEPISYVLQKIGEPEQITEQKEIEDLRDEYTTVTLHYPDFDISYWKGFSEVREIKIKTDKVSISEKNVKIGKTTISEILDLYQDIERQNYFLSEDKKGNQIIYIRFSTINHLFMTENADKDSFYHITYLFDYKKKLCVGVSMEKGANG
ncbi:MAG: hypothetical protein J5527_02510 [Treponema sp.]|nr:hypothetical protein [Treponema sp.]